SRTVTSSEEASSWAKEGPDRISVSALAASSGDFIAVPTSVRSAMPTGGYTEAANRIRGAHAPKVISPLPACSTFFECHRDGRPRPDAPRIETWVTGTAGLLASVSSPLFRLPGLTASGMWKLAQRLQLRGQPRI